MGLSQIWKLNREELTKKKINQIVCLAGDGKLKDNSETSDEFRKYLRIIPSEIVRSYVMQCIDAHFENSGLVLQDLLNEVGRRLDFEVEFGRYRGVAGKIGFDGIWTSQQNKKIIVEVKTTDAYRIGLNTVAEYRKKFALERAIDEDCLSILYVVGREDTGELESQVRGSRYAWDIRILGVVSILKLLEIKEKLEDPRTVNRIHEILVPKEFTRLDEIVELIFSTTEEAVISQNIEESLSEPEDDSDNPDQKKKFTPVSYREACVERYAQILKINLVKKSSALYETEDQQIGLIFLTSREYVKNDRVGYWYAFHPHQKDYLDKYPEKHVLLAMGSENLMARIPYNQFIATINNCNQTVLDDRFYWHIHIHKRDNKFIWVVKKDSEDFDITEYVLK